MTQVSGSIYRHFLLFISVLSKQNITWNRAFLVGLLVLPRENYPYHSMQFQRCATV